MKKLILFFSLIAMMSLTSCWSNRARTQGPSVNNTGYKAHKEAQKRVSSSFGRNLHGPNRFKKRHF